MDRVSDWTEALAELCQTPPLWVFCFAASRCHRRHQTFPRCLKIQCEAELEDQAELCKPSTVVKVCGFLRYLSNSSTTLHSKCRRRKFNTFGQSHNCVLTLHTICSCFLVGTPSLSHNLALKQCKVFKVLPVIKLQCCIFQMNSNPVEQLHDIPVNVSFSSVVSGICFSKNQFIFQETNVQSRRLKLEAPVAFFNIDKVQRER